MSEEIQRLEQSIANLQNNLSGTAHNLQSNQMGLQEQIINLDHKKMDKVVFNPKYVGKYETDITDYNENEPFVVTTITGDGDTLSIYYSNPDKTVSKPTDDEFTKLYMITENTGKFTRNYNTLQHFVSNTGEVIFSYLVAEHIFHFADDGNILYSNSCYSSNQVIEINPNFRELANQLGYITTGSKVCSRLLKRNKISH